MKSMMPVSKIYFGGYKDPVSGTYKTVKGYTFTFFPVGYPKGLNCLGADLNVLTGALDYSCQDKVSFGCYMLTTDPSRTISAKNNHNFKIFSFYYNECEQQSSYYCTIE